MTHVESMAPAERRDFLFYYARVCLREARARKARDPDYSKTLLGWAVKARRQAFAIDLRPAQDDLFG